MEANEENKDIIKVALNSNIEKTVYYCQKLLTKKNLKEINLCSIGQAYDTLRNVVNELKKRIPGLYIFGKKETIFPKNNRRYLIKNDIKIILGKPEKNPLGYYPIFNELYESNK